MSQIPPWLPSASATAPLSPVKPPLIPESAVTPRQITESPNSASSVKVPRILFSESNLVPSIVPNSFADVPTEIPALRQLRKKKKKFEVKLDSLIQADIQQLQKRGSFSVKQEVRDDAKLLDIPTSNLVKSVPPETLEVLDDDHIAPAPGDTLRTDEVVYPGPSAANISQIAIQDSNPQSFTSTTIVEPITIEKGQTNLDQVSVPIHSTTIPVPPQPDIFDHQTPMEVDLPSPTKQKIVSVVAPEGTLARQGSPDLGLDAMITQDLIAADVGEGQGLDVVMHHFADPVSCFLSTEHFAFNLVPLSKGKLSPKLSDGFPDGINLNIHATPITVCSPYTTPILPQTTPQLSTSEVSEAVASSLVIPGVIEDKGALRMSWYL